MSKQHNESLWQQLPAEKKQEIQQYLSGLRNGQANQPAPKAKSGFSLKGYVRCELAKADKEAFAQWELSQEVTDSLGVLLSLVDSGYILKIGESQEGYQASLSAVSCTGDWNGYVLTAHASSPVRATALLVYKHSIMLTSDWSVAIAPAGEEVLR